MNNGLDYKPKTRNPYVYWGMLVVVVLILVSLAEYPFIGQIAIGVYAALAFWRLESREVFKLALVGLLVVLVATVVGSPLVINAFSGYVFLLLLVGVFVLSRELWRFSQALRDERSYKEEDAKRA